MDHGGKHKTSEHSDTNTKVLSELSRFCRDILGFPVLYEGSGYCFLKAGGVNIVIHPVDTDSEFAPTGHGMYLDIIVADLQETRERLSDANIEIQREWKDHTGRFLLIADPNGNLLELIEPVGGG